jgi:hypothetical protein
VARATFLTGTAESRVTVAPGERRVRVEARRHARARARRQPDPDVQPASEPDEPADTEPLNAHAALPSSGMGVGWFVTVLVLGATGAWRSVGLTRSRPPTSGR